MKPDPIIEELLLDRPFVYDHTNESLDIMPQLSEQPLIDNSIKPSYYEGFDRLLESHFTNDELITSAEFNVLKYLYRWRSKNGLQDLKKAQSYLNSMIERLETKTEPNQ